MRDVVEKLALGWDIYYVATYEILRPDVGIPASGRNKKGVKCY